MSALAWTTVDPDTIERIIAVAYAVDIRERGESSRLRETGPRGPRAGAGGISAPGRGLSGQEVRNVLNDSQSVRSRSR